MIDGYALRMSVYPGDRLRLCVSTTAPAFSVRIYRQGATFAAMPNGSFGPFEGVASPPKPAGEAFDWIPYDVHVPHDWRPGCYVAILIEQGEGGVRLAFPDETQADGRDSRALFVVRADPRRAPAPILYKLPTFTYHAYAVPNRRYADAERERRGDGIDGQTFYTGAETVSLERNGCGTGGTPWDAFHAPDPYDRTTPRQTFAHWDAKFVAWLERNDYDVEFCTDVDLHDGPGEALQRHALVVCAGHDEYWSDEMRRHLEGFIERGGNVAFFGGNLLWWRVVLEDRERAIRRVEQFRNESLVTGATYAHGGGRWVGERSAIGFTVREPEHWAFRGTGLTAGATFGAERRLVGYETDGLPFSWTALGRDGGVEYDDDACPVRETLTLLATADVREWDGDPACGEIRGNASGVVTAYERGGTVFTAATVDWPRVLHEGDAIVDRITRNVIDRLSRPT